MKVKELIKILKEQNPEAPVILQKDSEGNGFSPLADLYAGGYVPTNTWSGEPCLLELTDEDRENGFTEEDVDNDGIKAIFLAPVN